MTSGVKVGQKIRFAGEGVVVEAGPEWTDLNTDAGLMSVRSRFVVEVLPEPLKIGDEIQLGSSPEPPVGTSIVANATGEIAKRYYGGWLLATSATGYYYEWIGERLHNAMTHFGTGSSLVRVVWLPGNQT